MCRVYPVRMPGYAKCMPKQVGGTLPLEAVTATDRVGFEPTVPLRAHRFSRPAVSTAHAPVLITTTACCPAHCAGHSHPPSLLVSVTRANPRDNGACRRQTDPESRRSARRAAAPSQRRSARCRCAFHDGTIPQDVTEDALDQPTRQSRTVQGRQGARVTFHLSRA